MLSHSIYDPRSTCSCDPFSEIETILNGPNNLSESLSVCWFFINTQVPTVGTCASLLMFFFEISQPSLFLSASNLSLRDKTKGLWIESKKLKPFRTSKGLACRFRLAPKFKEFLICFSATSSLCSLFILKTSLIVWLILSETPLVSGL